MDCAGCASSVTQAQQTTVQAQIQMAVVARQLDAQRQHGAAVLALLEAAVAISREPGQGEGVDLVA